MVHLLLVSRLHARRRSQLSAAGSDQLLFRETPLPNGVAQKFPSDST